METKSKHPHYYKDVSKLQVIDVYRVLQLFNVSDPCIQHAVKKLLVAGGRGAGKDITKDISEAIDSLKRWEEMDRENKIPLPMTLNITDATVSKSKVVPKPFPALQLAHNLIFGLLMGDDGQAVKEAERYLEANNPLLFKQYTTRFYKKD